MTIPVDPDVVPRQCRRIVNDRPDGLITWVAKVAYPDQESADLVVGDNVRMNPYLCDSCGSWHVGRDHDHREERANLDISDDPPPLLTILADENCAWCGQPRGDEAGIRHRLCRAYVRHLRHLRTHGTATTAQVAALDRAHEVTVLRGTEKPPVMPPSIEEFREALRRAVMRQNRARRKRRRRR